jgi:hypothetical protein
MRFEAIILQLSTKLKVSRECTVKTVLLAIKKERMKTAPVNASYFELSKYTTTKM